MRSTPCQWPPKRHCCRTNRKVFSGCEVDGDGFTGHVVGEDEGARVGDKRGWFPRGARDKTCSMDLVVNNFGQSCLVVVNLGILRSFTENRFG